MQFDAKNCFNLIKPFINEGFSIIKEELHARNENIVNAYYDIDLFNSKTMKELKLKVFFFGNIYRDGIDIFFKNTDESIKIHFEKRTHKMVYFVLFI